MAFNFTGSSEARLSRIPESLTSVTVSSSNNQYSYCYSESTYSIYRLVTPLYSLFAFITIGLFVVSLVTGSRRIPADAAVVLQTAYLGLVTLNKLTPLQEALTYL